MGEVTVNVTPGDGIGGRCSEMASKFVLHSDALGNHGSIGLFGTSDGQDGSSPAGAVIVNSGVRDRLSTEHASKVLSRSASYELVSEFGEPIIMSRTGNNLRDLVLLAVEDSNK